MICSFICCQLRRSGASCFGRLGVRRRFGDGGSSVTVHEQQQQMGNEQLRNLHLEQEWTKIYSSNRLPNHQHSWFWALPNSSNRTNVSSILRPRPRKRSLPSWAPFCRGRDGWFRFLERPRPTPLRCLHTGIRFLSFFFLEGNSNWSFFFFLKRTIKGERVLQDLNILKEAGGPKMALIKTLVANVTNTAIDIHLMWAGRGTCCIPFQSTYGPLVSAIRVSQGSWNRIPYIPFDSIYPRLLISRVVKVSLVWSGLIQPGFWDFRFDDFIYEILENSCSVSVGGVFEEQGEEDCGNCVWVCSRCCDNMWCCISLVGKEGVQDLYPSS